jgi:hypothetical protein
MTTSQLLNAVQVYELTPSEKIGPPIPPTTAIKSDDREHIRHKFSGTVYARTAYAAIIGAEPDKLILCYAFGSQKICDLILGKAQSLAIRSQIIGKVRRSHGDGCQRTPLRSPGLHNNGLIKLGTTWNFAGSGKIPQKNAERSRSAKVAYI